MDHIYNRNNNNNNKDDENYKMKWGGFNLEYGNLKNGKLKAILISKITAMGISKKKRRLSRI